MSRTTKKNRIACSLTILAIETECKLNSPISHQLYNIAKENKIGMFDGIDYGIEGLIFIPQDYWDTRLEFVRNYQEQFNVYTHMANYVKHWRDRAVKMREQGII